jgi:hypothetical protein
MLDIRSLIVASVVGLGVAACSDDTHAPPETPDANAAKPFECTGARVVNQVRFDNASCLPRALPTDSSGRVGCHIFISRSAGCDVARGERPLDSAARCALSSEIAGGGVPEPSSLCELDQLVGTECAPSPIPGWCYVAGSAATGCPAALHTSAGSNISPGMPGYLTCENPSLQ